MNTQTTILSKAIAICTILLLTLTVTMCKNDTDSDSEVSMNEVNTIPEIIPEPIVKYNFVLDSFIVDTGRVMPNQGLTHILPKYGISTGEIYTLANKTDSLFDVKKIKPNHKYMTLSHMEDTIKKAEYFIYEIDAEDYIVYGFKDSITAYIESKDIDLVRKSSGGIITSSLWNAFMDQGLSPALLVDFTKLFAWSVDFFDVKEGDFYKVIYDAKYIEGEFIGVGDIHAVLFNHKKHDNYFFRYSSDTIQPTFFTDSGEQMQRALLSAPLEYTRVSSKFSHNRFHPVLKIYRPHHGVDYAAPTGTDVVATGSGTVIHAAYSGGAGHMIKIKHDVGNILTKYLHLSKYAPGIKKGTHVVQGQKIGEVGSTGTSTGPHLDYRVYIDGTAVDPLSIDIPTVDPLKDSALVLYLQTIEPVRMQLDSIEIYEILPPDTTTTE